MYLLDYFIEQFSKDTLIECKRCGQWFKTIRECWKHKMGNGVEPCSESFRPCFKCHKIQKVKYMTNGMCENCKGTPK